MMGLVKWLNLNCFFVTLHAPDFLDPGGESLIVVFLLSYKLVRYVCFIESVDLWSWDERLVSECI
jgi:hypothetical protein